MKGKMVDWKPIVVSRAGLNPADDATKRTRSVVSSLVMLMEADADVRGTSAVVRVQGYLFV